MLNTIYEILNNVYILISIFWTFVFITLFKHTYMNITIIRIRLVFSVVIYVIYLVLAVLCIIIGNHLTLRYLICAAIWAYIIYTYYKDLLQVKELNAIITNFLELLNFLISSSDDHEEDDNNDNKNDQQQNK